MTATLVHPTDHGPLHLEATAAGLSRVGFSPGTPEEGTPQERAVLARAAAEIDAYLAGELTEFTVPVDLSAVGTTHRRVLDRLREVGHGETTTYGTLAAAAGLEPVGARRVGGMMASNPVAIVVPCHRVVGADGALTGYAGGVALKRALLDLEARETMLF